MSNRGLEALNYLITSLNHYHNHTMSIDEKNAIKEIETALDRLEELEKDFEMEHTLRIRLENANYELVREKEKQDEILRIIKEKRPDWSHFFRLILEERFNDKTDLWKVRVLNRFNEYDKTITIKEFNLLKECLK